MVCRLPTEPDACSSGGWNRTSGLHVQSVASLPAATAPESSYFGKEDSNLHRLIQSQGACQLADSRERLRESNPPVGPGKPVPGRSAQDAHCSIRLPTIESERDRGFEPRSPGWKPGVVPLDQSRRVSCQAEGEGVEPSRLIARPSSNRVPSPIGLPFRNRRCLTRTSRQAPAGGVEPPIVALTGRRLTVGPHRYRTRGQVGMAGFEPAISCSRSRRIEPGFPTSRTEVPSGSRTRTSAMARR